MGTPYCDTDLEGMMIRRISDRINIKHLADNICGSSIVIAGGSMLASDPNDYDVYAAYAKEPLDFNLIVSRADTDGWEKIGETRNGFTFRDPKGKIVQFCRYAKDDPDELIKSFDFAHCQVGVSVSSEAFGSRCAFHCTSDFMRAMAMQRTFFVGTEYPMSSLVRLVKYAKRGLYGDGRGYMPDMVRIVTNIIDRGFYGMDDFHDQFDAIDLGYEGKEVNELWSIVEQCLIKPDPKRTERTDDTDDPF